MFIGVAWQYRGTDGARSIRFRKNTINGTTGHWQPIEYFGTPANCFDDFPCLQMTHGTYPSAVIMFVRQDTVGTDNADLYRITTDDGADNWSTESQYNSSWAANVPQGLGVNDTLGYYHLVYRDQDGTLRYQKSRYDSTWFAWSAIEYPSSGNTYNEYHLPAVGVRNHQPYVCWDDWHSPVYKLKFDAEWLFGINEHNTSNPYKAGCLTIAPNPTRNSFTICYNVARQGPVTVNIYEYLRKVCP